MDTTPQMQWNRGGWLGGQLGGSCWMFVAGALTFPLSVATAALVLGIFGLSNAIGFWLWSRRDRLSPYRAIQILMFVLMLAGMLAVYILDRGVVWHAIQSGQAVSPRQMYLMLPATFGGLLFMFYFQFGRQPRR